MSLLTLVRHAQASFFADDYDRLSPLGETQSRRLGEYWTRQGTVFREVFVGPRRRQQQTCDLVGVEFRRAGLPWPEPVVLPELDEYDLLALQNRLAKRLAEVDSSFERLVNAHESSTGETERARTFQRMFEAVLKHWQDAPSDAFMDPMESWPSFRDRVERALSRITDRAGKGSRVAAFSSGGFIGAAVARTLSAPDNMALELSWRLRNAALTNLVFSPGKRTLDDFNTMPHLTEPDLLTYR